MIHHSTCHRPLGDHYAVGASTNSEPHPCFVLAQLQENGEQARVLMTPAEARAYAQLLLAAADKVEAHLRARTQSIEQAGDERALLKLTVTKSGTELTVDDLATPGSPPVGRGASLKEAVGDWLLNNQTRLGISFDTVAVQADIELERERALGQR
jgi:dsDNA-binding SOS-regulon protein